MFNALKRATFGGVIGFLIWLALYLRYKTPAIEPDGSAGLMAVASIITGAIVIVTAYWLRSFFRN